MQRLIEEMIEVGGFLELCGDLGNEVGSAWNGGTAALCHGPEELRNWR